MSPTESRPPHILFVTDRLAENSLRRMVDDLAARAGFVPHVAVMPVSVAALMPARRVARHVEVNAHCAGDLEPIIVADGGRSVGRGPLGLHDLLTVSETSHRAAKSEHPPDASLPPRSAEPSEPSP